MSDPAPFSFGIEHEMAFMHGNTFADHTNTTYEAFAALIANLPVRDTDYKHLRTGDLGIKTKRWYVEGNERFDDTGALAQYVPKGIEVRTIPHPTIDETCAALCTDVTRLCQAAHTAGMTPAWTSYNPFHTGTQVEPPLSAYERHHLATHPEERTDHLTVYTFGPDLNLSQDGMSDDAMIDIGKKLTYYSPYLVPFSFSSPFYEDALWDGYSVRTFIRTGDRHAVRVFVEHEHSLLPDHPLTMRARIPGERYRIEFKAFDTCIDTRLYAALLALLKGLVLDDTLNGRAHTPDKARHQFVARTAFDDATTRTEAGTVLTAAHDALRADPDQVLLTPLFDLLDRHEVPAHRLIERYHETGSILETLRDSYARWGNLISLDTPEHSFAR